MKMLHNEILRASYSFNLSLLFHCIVQSNVLGKQGSKFDFKHCNHLKTFKCNTFCGRFHDNYSLIQLIRTKNRDTL